MSEYERPADDPVAPLGRDDVNWLKHTFVTLQDGKQEITYKPVTLTKFEPKERKY